MGSCGGGAAGGPQQRQQQRGGERDEQTAAGHNIGTRQVATTRAADRQVAAISAVCGGGACSTSHPNGPVNVFISGCSS